LLRWVPLHATDNPTLKDSEPWEPSALKVNPTISSMVLFMRRIIRRCLTKGVGSSDPTVFSTVAVKLQTNCRRHLSDQLVRRHLHKPSDHLVLNADLNSEPTALIIAPAD